MTDPQQEEHSVALHLRSCLNEHVVIRCETYNHACGVVSLAISDPHQTEEGAHGIAVSLFRRELIAFRDALNEIIGGAIA